MAAADAVFISIWSAWNYLFRLNFLVLHTCWVSEWATHLRTKRRSKTKWRAVIMQLRQCNTTNDFISTYRTFPHSSRALPKFGMWMTAGEWRTKAIQSVPMGIELMVLLVVMVRFTKEIIDKNSTKWVFCSSKKCSTIDDDDDDADEDDGNNSNGQNVSYRLEHIKCISIMCDGETAESV